MKYDMKNIKLDELAALVNTTLKENGIDTVLVGGTCVSIYTANKFQSYDLDFISHSGKRKIDLALDLIGFRKDKNKYYVHPACPYYIEFVSPPVSIGEEKIEEFNIVSNRYGEIKLLTVTDCVKDRLAAYYHWNDYQSLEQALLVANNNHVDLESIEAWSEKEGYTKKCRDFIQKLK